MLSRELKIDVDAPPESEGTGERSARRSHEITNHFALYRGLTGRVYAFASNPEKNLPRWVVRLDPESNALRVVKLP